MRRSVLLVVLCLLGVLAGVPTSGPAGAAPTGPGRLVPGLPFDSTWSPTRPLGEAHPAALEAAVGTACNDGDALPAATWYTLPARDLGAVYARGQGLWLPGRSLESVPLHTAFVLRASAQVLQCGEGPVDVSGSATVAVVAWFEQADLDTCDCASDVQVVVDRGRRNPPGDSWRLPVPVRHTPYVRTVNTAFADDDDPGVTALDCPGVIPENAGTVWFRYTPTVSGRLPLSVSVPTFARSTRPAVYEKVALAEVTPTGPVPVPAPLDLDACQPGPYDVHAGTTYLIGVFSRWDPYLQGPPLVTGTRVTLSVGTPVPVA